MSVNTGSYLPLTEPAFYILLSLIPEKKHGYAILKEVENLSQGSVSLSTSTLYGALSRLQEQGLIKRVSIEEKDIRRPGLPRKSYMLTETGRTILRLETARLKVIVSAASRLIEQEGV